MRILSLDCRSEFTGESLVGALADLGVSPSTFEWELSGIDIGDHHLHFDREEIQGMRAVRFGVHGGTLHVDHHHSSEHHHAHTHPEDDHILYTRLREQIEAAKLSHFVKTHSLGILHRIANALGELAETPVDQIEFAEADALEWLVTAVLSCVGLDQLQAKQIYFKQTIQLQPTERQPSHDGLSRVILSKVSGHEHIEASPVGAAILAEFGVTLDTPPKLQSVKTGWGLGPEENQGHTSMLRTILGETE
jgi:uncharacterized protein (DUF111 family)